MANVSDAYGKFHIELLDGSEVKLEEIKEMLEYFNTYYNDDIRYRMEWVDLTITKDSLVGTLNGFFSADGKWSVENNFNWLETDKACLEIWDKYKHVRGFKIIVDFEELESGEWFFIPDGKAIILFKKDTSAPSVELFGTAIEPTKEVLRASRWFSEDVNWMFYDWDTGEPERYNDIIELDDEDRPKAIFANLVRSGSYKDIIGDIEIDKLTKDHYDNFIKADPNNINKLLNLLEEAREVHEKYLIELEQRNEEMKKLYDKNIKQQ